MYLQFDNDVILGSMVYSSTPWLVLFINVFPFIETVAVCKYTLSTAVEFAAFATQKQYWSINVAALITTSSRLFAQSKGLFLMLVMLSPKYTYFVVAL